jgi:hypothetical protein
MAFNPNEYLVKLKGKDYLEVKYRIVWFRDEWPHGTIDSQHIEISDKHAIFRATVGKIDAEGNVKGTATGYGSETVKDFGDFIEKAETKAIGRALAALGYGTAFAPELDEGERIVDAPVEPRRTPQAPQQPRNATQLADTIPDPPKPTHSAGMRKIHAVGNQHGFSHEELRMLCDREEYAANKQRIASMNDAPEALLHYVADLITKNPENQRKWIDLQSKQAQAELLPDVHIVPNPDRHTG